MTVSDCISLVDNRRGHIVLGREGVEYPIRKGDYQSDGSSRHSRLRHLSPLRIYSDRARRVVR
jgi:hypothetical protein